jgi:hypothetical protein
LTEGLNLLDMKHKAKEGRKGNEIMANDKKHSKVNRKKPKLGKGAKKKTKNKRKYAEAQPVILGYREEDFPKLIRVSDGYMHVTLTDARIISTPIRWYPPLRNATEEQILKAEFSGMGLHWREFDEDLSIEGMLWGLGDKSGPEDQPILQEIKALRNRWHNMSQRPVHCEITDSAIIVTLDDGQVLTNPLY